MPREQHVNGDRIEREVDDEINFHIESRIGELMERGQDGETARRTAEAEFGDLRASRRELATVDRRRQRRESVKQILGAAIQDIRQSARSLRRSPAFTLTAALTLAIGIASTVSIFAVVNGVLLRPLPYPEPERLVGAWHDLNGVGLLHSAQTVSTYFTYQRLARTIEGIGVYRSGEVNVSAPGNAAEPQRVSSASISATLMPVLRVAPALGRGFTVEDDRRGATPVALIDEVLWRTRFSADPRILGRTLEVNGVSREIVGVMGEQFHFPSAATRLWIPIQLDPLDPPGSGWEYDAVARLKPDVTIGQAERDFAAVLPQAAQLFPKFVPGISTSQIMDQTRPAPRISPLREDITGPIARTLGTVAMAAALLLLVACANVANLILVRADARQRELAVREALGAGRSRVMLHFLSESAVISAVAASLGLSVAVIAVRALVGAGPAGIPRLDEVRIDAGTILFTLALTAVVAAACSLLPALRLGAFSRALREGGRSGTTGRSQHRVRGALVAAQIALGFVVLASSGLLMRTYEQLSGVSPGFDPEHVSTSWISLPAVRYAKQADVGSFYSRLIDRIAAVPGVRAVGLTSRLPLESHGLNENPLYPEDDPSYATTLPPLELFTATGGDYFRAMAVPVVVGRTFAPIGTQREGDAVISLSTARFFWKDSTGASALGQRFRPLPTGRLYTVIGVVGDMRDTSLAAPASRAVYLPETLEEGGGFGQMKRTIALVVRTTDERIPVEEAVRRAVRELDPSLPTFDVRPMSAVFNASTAQLSFIILLLGSAAAVTLVLGAVGLYGVLAYVVTLRRRELGIRIALGAMPRSVAAAMARYGVGLTAFGIAFGLLVFALVGRLLRTMLFGVSVADPWTLSVSAGILLGVAMVASLVPARRAARVDLTEVLRAE